MSTYVEMLFNLHDVIDGLGAVAGAGITALSFYWHYEAQHGPRTYLVPALINLLACVPVWMFTRDRARHRRGKPILVPVPVEMSLAPRIEQELADRFRPTTLTQYVEAGM